MSCTIKKQDIHDLKQFIELPNIPSAGGWTPTLPYPLNSNTLLLVQKSGEEWLQLIFMLIDAIEYGCSGIYLTTLIDQSEHTERITSGTFALWTQTLR
jgi:hypothetical protein